MYLMARTAGSLFKVSFHRPRILGGYEGCQISIEKGFHESLPTPRQHPSGTRHRGQWLCQPPDANGFRLAARQFFPRSGLGARTDEIPPGTKKLVLPPNVDGVDVTFLFGSVGTSDDSWPETIPATAPIARWRLKNGEVLLAIPSSVTTSVAEEADLIVRRQQLRHGVPEWSSGAVDYGSPKLGGVLHGPQSNGSYLIAELGLS